MHLRYLVELITQKSNRNISHNSRDGFDAGGARTRRTRPPFAASVIAAVPGNLVSVLCDQVDQVVPAHQVDDTDDAQQQDAIHQADHKDEHQYVGMSGFSMMRVGISIRQSNKHQ